MAAENRFAGTVYVYANGRQLDIRGKCKVVDGTIKREGIAGQDGVHGYKEMPGVPSIQVDLSLVRNGITLSELRDIDNATVTAVAANGTNYVLSNAWTADTYEHDTEEGSVSVKFEGMSLQETR